MKWSIVILGTSLALVKGHHHHHHHHPPPPPPPACTTETVTRHCEPCKTATQTVTIVVPDPTTETMVDYRTRTIVNEVTETVVDYQTQTVVNEVTATVVNEVTATQCVEHVETQTIYVPTTVPSCKGGRCKSNPKPTPPPPPPPQPAPEQHHGHHHHHHHGHHHHHHHKCHHHQNEYTVRPGDCCWGIAQANGMTLQELKTENPWLNSKCDLNPGETICVSEPSHHHHHAERDVDASDEVAEPQVLMADVQDEITVDAAVVGEELDN